MPESQARLLFVAAGLAALPQHAVYEHGRLIGWVDFGWPAHKLAAEIDGYAWHSSYQQFQDDRTRQNRLELAGWRVLRYTVQDIRDRPDLVLRQIREALAAG